MPDDQVRLNGVAIEEVLRRLYQPYTGVVEKGNGSPQKLAMRHEVGVENRDEFGRVGIIAQDGEGIVRPAQVKGAFFLAQSLEPGSTPVITNPDTHAGEIDAKRADDAAR